MQSLQYLEDLAKSEQAIFKIHTQPNLLFEFLT